MNVEDAAVDKKNPMTHWQSPLWLVLVKEKHLVAVAKDEANSLL